MGLWEYEHIGISNSARASGLPLRGGDTTVTLQQQRAMESARDVLISLGARMDLEARDHHIFLGAALRPELEYALQQLNKALEE